MGLVNLRSASLLLFSVDQEKLKQINTICIKGGYKSITTANSIPATLTNLKQKKIDILLFDTNLGGTDSMEFGKAIRVAFPKIKILPIISQDATSLAFESIGITKTANFPLDQENIIKILEDLMMQKMGITQSSVAVSE